MIDVKNRNRNRKLQEMAEKKAGPNPQAFAVWIKKSKKKRSSGLI